MGLDRRLPLHDDVVLPVTALDRIESRTLDFCVWFSVLGGAVMASFTIPASLKHSMPLEHQIVRPSPELVGTICACYGTDWMSRTISLGTCSLYRQPFYGPSHVAILIEHEGELRWLESTTMSHRACLFHQEVVTGVQIHHPLDRMEDYGGRVLLYPLSPIWRLSQPESQLLTKIAVDHFLTPNVGYQTGRAILSGSRLATLLQLVPAPRLQAATFCSELISALYQRLNRTRSRNPGYVNPARLIRTQTDLGRNYLDKSLRLVAS